MVPCNMYEIITWLLFIVSWGNARSILNYVHVPVLIIAEMNSMYVKVKLSFGKHLAINTSVHFM